MSWYEHWFKYSLLTLCYIVVSWCEHSRLLYYMCECYFAGNTIQATLFYIFSLQTYAWPLLGTVFSEIFTREEWLRLFDHVFSTHPGFVLAVIVAYCSCSRAPLMKCVERDDFTVRTSALTMGNDLFIYFYLYILLNFYFTDTHTHIKYIVYYFIFPVFFPSP